MTEIAPASRNEKADHPIRTAVIGFGRAGTLQHAPQLAASPHFDLSAVVTGDPGRAALIHHDYPGTAVVSSVEELWKRSDDLDLIVIASPNVSHVPYARIAIGLGLPVVIDKPIATNSVEARALVEEARAAGVLLTVYQNRRWDGDFLTVADLVGEGAFGEVYEFESRFTWWEPEPPLTWKAAASVGEGGGALFDLGPHLIDQAIRLFGPPAELHAELDRRRPRSHADDDSLVLITHRSGVRSRLWMSCVNAQSAPRFRVSGSRAAFTKPGLDPQETQAERGMSPQDPEFGVDTRENWGLLGIDGDLRAVPTRRGDYAAFYRELADSLRNGTRPPVDPGDSVAVLEVIERLHATYPIEREGRDDR
jgi:predicted dehydrogenase